MERDQQLTTDVRNYCDKIGVDVVGFADPLLFERYSEENRPHAFLKDLKTVIVIGFHLYDIILDAWTDYDIVANVIGLVEEASVSNVYLGRAGYEAKADSGERTI